jgi:gamma-glutamyltranspeptidase/glutathione hydrolase
MLIWRADAAAAEYVDFYPMQPVARFRGHTGFDGDGDLRIVGVPGSVAGLLAAHERFGRLPRALVMAPAIRLADAGFPVGQILALFIRSDSAKLAQFPSSFAHVWPRGAALDVGDVLRNPQLATTLRAIAEQGADAFYRGTITKDVVRTLNAHKHPVTIGDFAAYEPVWRRPLCIGYRGLHVLSAPPPQTGVQVLHTLQLLEPFDLAALGLPTRAARAFDVVTSALRVGMADNRAQNDDPRWRSVYAAGRNAPAVAAERAALVGAAAVTDSLETASAASYDSAEPEPGCARFAPYGAAPASAARPQDGDQPDGGETTHISVADAEGNAVALTQTNSTTFGSGAFVNGFFLNDSGYLFRTPASVDSIAAPWRTRTSTIAPTIVLNGDSVELVIGAPGGGRIPTEIAQTMIYLLDYRMDPLDAVRMPRIYPSATTPRVQLEHGFAPALLRDVRAMGYDPVPPAPGYARLYLVARRDGRWVAVADPRHDGEARAY